MNRNTAQEPGLLPFHAGNDGEGQDNCNREIRDANNVLVAFLPFIHGNRLSDFIVLACNTHNELVEALEISMSYFNEFMPAETYLKLEAILAKAKK